MKDMNCGYVAILGVPNAGKSTLVNALVGSKVSIVSPKVQTTRNRVLGITIHQNSQIILMDTPGIFMPKRRLERAMVKAAWSASGDADITCLIIDVSKKDLGPQVELLKRLNEQKINPILLLNKIDLISKEQLLEISQKLTTDQTVDRVFMISAKKQDGLKELLDHLDSAMPKGPWLFPEDQMTDAPMRLLASEITREKLFLSLRQELPYSLMVETDKWEQFENGSVKITQTITVQREGQKAIVIGKQGTHIKKIGEASREELKHILDCDVHLILYVKVRENWLDKPEHYQDIGLEFNV